VSITQRYTTLATVRGETMRLKAPGPEKSSLLPAVFAIAGVELFGSSTEL